MIVSLLRNLTAIVIRASTLGAKFLLVLCMVRYFQPVELGLYGVLTALVAYALFFLGLEYYNYTSRMVVDATALEKVLILRDQSILYAISFLVFTPLFYVLFQLQIVPSQLFCWFLLITVFEHASNELMRTLVAMARPYLANFIFFIRQGLWVYILLPVFIFYPDSRHFEVILLAWIAGAALSLLIGFIPLYSLPWRSMWQHAIRWKLIRAGLLVSRPFLISAFCALSLIYIERFFVNYYCGMEAVGIYTFYTGLSITLHTLVNTGVAKMRLAQLLAAWKQGNRAQFQIESSSMLKYTVLFVVAFALLCIVLVKPFLLLIDRPIYLANLDIFYVLLLGAAFRGIADVPLYTLYAQHRDRLILLINLTSFLVLVTGNSVLVPQWGLMGAAFASAAASIVLLCYALSMMIYSARSQPAILAT